uniref:FAM194 C-terminal domain-containing protein n=1 Tax=Scophthalmus maximus TaxID=52904 RepID=A0A8D3DE85_SCOMX
MHTRIACCCFTLGQRHRLHFSSFPTVRGTETKMRSGISIAAATSVHEPPRDLKGRRIPEGRPQSVSDPPTNCVRAAGVLRYNRESDDDNRINLTTVLSAPPPLTEYAVKCEYCGELARPSLDQTWLEEPETATHFCCVERQQLRERLVKWRCLCEGRRDRNSASPTSPENSPTTDAEELLFQGRENEFTGDIRGLGAGSEVKIYEDYSMLPVAETFAPPSKVLSFRLSCVPRKGCRTVYSDSRATERCPKEEEAQVLVPFCDHKPLQFGMCHHQDGAELLNKYYSSGMKCLTLFPDGSAQVFYPSGLLALIVVVTEEDGRVCIVYDDSDAPHQAIRAVFQSDGRATCYHSSGNIWLSLHRSGGQCLDEAGARVRRWSWDSLSLTPTALQPVFLSLNKSVGIRVLGIEQVFVTFLAQGQQAKFSVGTCCAQGESKTHGPTSEPPLTKEDLLASAARIRTHLAIQHLHQCLITPSHPQLPKPTKASHLHAVAQRLLEDSPHVMMSESERAFINKCLQGFSLMPSYNHS